MSFDRTERISGEIMRAVAEILREIKDPRMKGMISVMSVRTAKDLSYAKITVSVLGTDEEKRSAEDALNSAAGFIRRELSHRVDLRITPKLSFVLSDAIEHSSRISKMISDAMGGKPSNE